jgi:hypothetical protein
MSSFFSLALLGISLSGKAEACLKANAYRNRLSEQ